MGDDETISRGDDNGVTPLSWVAPISLVHCETVGAWCAREGERVLRWGLDNSKLV